VGYLKAGITPITDSIIIRTNARISAPLILLWGLYVLIHGSLGPGGGFQAGVILASSFILYTVAFGLKETKKLLPVKFIMVLSTIGLFMYAGMGMLAIFYGGNFLEYGKIPIGHSLAYSSKYSIEIVEVGIGITVMATMATIFYELAYKKEKEEK